MNKAVTYNANQTMNSKMVFYLTAIDSPPFVECLGIEYFGSICGPIAKLIREMSIVFGYR
jgi:hypothetical protein